MSGGGTEAAQERVIVYCVVPSALARELHEPLRKHFRDDPWTEVVVERRSADRRASADRRLGETPAYEGRRKIRAAGGRRVADRRAASVDTSPPSLPRRARPHAAALSFVERMEPTSLEREDRDTARLVIRFQAGERELYSEIYLRYFERIYAYVRVALEDPEAAEEATQHVFMRGLEALPRYERRRQPFRAWLFVIARNHVLDVQQRAGRIESVDPSELARRIERESEPSELTALSWISDRELLMFIERLPAPQRQVLVLRFMLGLNAGEIAEVMGRSSADVRMLQSRALAFLRARLASLGRGAERHVPRSRSHACIRPAQVLRARRFALLG